MPSLEDDPPKMDDLIIERFEALLAQLLASHAAYQKQIIHLREENKVLKSLLEASKRRPPLPANHASLRFDHHLVEQINQYIKEIDLCLAYFEQV